MKNANSPNWNYDGDESDSSDEPLSRPEPIDKILKQQAASNYFANILKPFESRSTSETDEDDEEKDEIFPSFGAKKTKTVKSGFGFGSLVRKTEKQPEPTADSSMPEASREVPQDIQASNAESDIDITATLGSAYENIATEDVVSLENQVDTTEPNQNVDLTQDVPQFESNSESAIPDVQAFEPSPNLHDETIPATDADLINQDPEPAPVQTNAPRRTIEPPLPPHLNQDFTQPEYANDFSHRPVESTPRADQESGPKISIDSKANTLLTGTLLAAVGASEILSRKRDKKLAEQLDANKKKAQQELERAQKSQLTRSEAQATLVEHQKNQIKKLDQDKQDKLPPLPFIVPGHKNTPNETYQVARAEEVPLPQEKIDQKINVSTALRQESRAESHINAATKIENNVDAKIENTALINNKAEIRQSQQFEALDIDQNMQNIYYQNQTTTPLEGSYHSDRSMDTTLAREYGPAAVPNINSDSVGGPVLKNDDTSSYKKPVAIGIASALMLLTLSIVAYYIMR